MSQRDTCLGGHRPRGTIDLSKAIPPPGGSAAIPPASKGPDLGAAFDLLELGGGRNLVLEVRLSYKTSRRGRERKVWSWIVKEETCPHCGCTKED